MNSTINKYADTNKIIDEDNQEESTESIKNHLAIPPLNTNSNIASAENSTRNLIFQK